VRPGQTEFKTDVLTNRSPPVIVSADQ